MDEFGDGVSESFYKIRTFEVSNLEGGEVRVVKHYHTHCWPDFGVPNEKWFKSFNGLVDTVIAEKEILDLACGKTKQPSPVVVHCRAGVGRTGTFISIFELKNLIKIYQKEYRPLSKIAETDRGLSVIGTVRCLREQRCHSVETSAQYIYIYRFIQKVLQ
jgi:protein tyrosine phosphatase